MEPPELEDNPSSPEKMELGRMLYFEPRLSSSWLISCNTCHNVGLAGVDLMETSIGHGWQKGPRNAPTVRTPSSTSPSSGTAGPGTWRSRPRGQCRPEWR
jgi:cytochrome c peroxidase